MTAKETSLEFVERMEAAHVVSGAPVMYSRSNMLKILHLAKTTALIEKHELWVEGPYRHHDTYKVSKHGPTNQWTDAVLAESTSAELHTAVRVVADKIKERT